MIVQCTLCDQLISMHIPSSLSGFSAGQERFRALPGSARLMACDVSALGDDSESDVR